MKFPKVLVFTPVYEAKDYCLAKFLANAKKLSYPNIKHIIIDNSTNEQYITELKRKYQSWGFEFYRVERGSNSREAIARAQNFARNKAIEGKYDYLFSLESDIMCPPDIIEKLMSHGKDVISGVYLIGNDTIKIPCITLAYFDNNLMAYGTRLLKMEEIPEYMKKGLKQVQAGGFGCTLIYKRIFEKFVFTYDPRFTGHSDIYFFNYCYNARIPVFVDTDVFCEHENSDWDKVKDR